MRIFSPKRYVSSVDRIDLDTLWADGKRAILLDRDNTLVPRDTEQVPAAVSAWLDAARAKGFKLCMVSNNWHRDGHELCTRAGTRGHQPRHEAGAVCSQGGS